MAELNLSVAVEGCGLGFRRVFSMICGVSPIHQMGAKEVVRVILLKCISELDVNSDKDTDDMCNYATKGAGEARTISTLGGEDGAHREATTSRPLPQSCIARVPRHARRGIVTIYTSASEKALSTYRAISDFLAKVASASQLTVEWRRRAIIAYAFREYGILRRLLPPIIGDQMMLPLT